MISDSEFDLAALIRALKDQIKSIESRLMNCDTDRKETQELQLGKIERYHRTMKNIIKLEHYFSPEELEAHIAEFVNYYNNQRYHESLNNVTPADVFFGRDLEILARRERIKQRTLLKRRLDFEVQKTTLI